MKYLLLITLLCSCAPQNRWANCWEVMGEMKCMSSKNMWGPPD